MSLLLSLLGFPRSFLPGFPCILSRFPYLAFCWFPFVLPCFAPAAVPQVIPFQTSPPGPMLDFRFLSSASVLAPHYSASVSSFPFSTCFRLTVASSVHPSAFASLVFPVLSSLISHAFLPGSGTQLSVCFLSPFLASLPTAVPRVLPLCFRFRAFPLPFRFLSSPYVPPPATQPLFLPFLLFPVSPHSGFPGARFRSRFFAFPFLSGLISHAFLPVISTRLSVRFLSSFPVSLPQLFHWCFPSFPGPCVPFSSGLSPSFSAFFRPLLFRF